jgi:hypothetical protein
LEVSEVDCRGLRRLLGRSSSTSTQIAELLRSSEDGSGADTRFPGLGSFPACARSFMGSESTASGGTGEEERPGCGSTGVSPTNDNL